MNTLFSFALFQATFVFVKDVTPAFVHQMEWSLHPHWMWQLLGFSKAHFMTKQLEYGVTHRKKHTHIIIHIVAHSQCGAIDFTQYTSSVSWTSTKPWTCSQRLAAARVWNYLFVPLVGYCAYAMFIHVYQSVLILYGLHLWDYGTEAAVQMVIANL